MFRSRCLIWMFACAAATAQTIDITPTGPVVEGDPVAIRLAGLAPNSSVTVSAERLLRENGKEALYRAQATFAADAAGKLDLSTAKPASGTYRGADIHGLFWSMAPSANAVPPGMARGQLVFEAQVEGKAVAKAVLQLVNTLPTVVTESVPGFPGAVYSAIPGPGKRPVLIILGGSEGGSSAAREMAPNFAARGFAVFGLPYYSPAAWNNPVRELPSLPQSFVDIPVDRLALARAWLMTRKDVDANRIGILGFSKGAEFVLIAASKMKWISSVVAIVPSDVVWQGWGPDVVPADSARSSFSYEGKALPFVPNKDFLQEMAGFQTGADVRYRRPYDKGRAAFPAAAVSARIRVEDFKGPMLVAGGIEDQMWASGMMAQNIAERRAGAKLETVALIYTDAGHGLTGNGWVPTTQYNAGPFKTGGTAEANARAQAEIWQTTLAFLSRTLALRP